MRDRPFALHITWTCYGNWLPGDPRGYVSNIVRSDGGYDCRQNTPGTAYTRNHAATFDRAKALQKWPTVRLTGEQARCVVASVLGAAAARGWRVLRAAVMSNHVHVVIAHCPDDGPAVRRILKGVSQAALSAAAGGPRRWWTEAGSDRYKHDDDAITAAVRYVADQAGMLAGVDDMRAFVVNGDRTIRYLDDAPGERPAGERSPGERL